MKCIGGTRDIARGDWGKGKRAMPLEDGGEAPSACNLVERSVECELTPTAKRQLVNNLTDQGVRRVEVRQSVIGGGMVRILINVNARSVTIPCAGIERL